MTTTATGSQSTIQKELLEAWSYVARYEPAGSTSLVLCVGFASTIKSVICIINNNIKLN